MGEIFVTDVQVNLMLHAIGYQEHKVKRKKYKAYRNYFADKPNQEWEKLIECGYAWKTDSLGEDEGVMPQKFIYYHVSQKGVDFLCKLTGVAITLDKEAT